MNANLLFSLRPRKNLIRSANSVWPFIVAICIGVWLSEFTRVGSAPHERSRSTAALWLAAAATCNGVSPLVERHRTLKHLSLGSSCCGVHRALTSAPYISSRLICSTRFRRAACVNGNNKPEYSCSKQVQVMSEENKKMN